MKKPVQAKRYLFEVVVRYDPKERRPYKYTVDVPALPGCFTEGRSRSEALRNAREVIALMLSARSGRRRPRGSALVEVTC